MANLENCVVLVSVPVSCILEVNRNLLALAFHIFELTCELFSHPWCCPSGVEILHFQPNPDDGPQCGDTSPDDGPQGVKLLTY